MPHYLSAHELGQTTPAELDSFELPVPTQVVSNGEYNPLPQTREQQRVEARITELADDLGPRHGLSRRAFLASSAGMAAAFLAMNDVFGPVFDVSRAEAQQPGVAAQRAGALAGQFIIDVQTHFVRDDFKQAGLLDLAKYAKKNWNPGLAGENDLARYKFENYVREIFVDSDTKVALLSGAPFDDQTWDLLTNDQIAAGRAAINRIADSRRMLAHAVFTPKKSGWMGEVDRAIAELKPDSWKGYTIGDPLFPSKAGSYWRLDDTKLMYPFYEKIAKSGVSNVYGEIGTSFATCAVANPRMAAALVGTLVRGLGADHVLWGTDSVWYGSPQWQIEAMRRLEIPDEMRRKHNFAALGPADGAVKTAIFSGNAARL